MCGAPARNGLRPLDVERSTLASLNFGEVATDVIEIDARRNFFAGVFYIRCAQRQQRRAFEDRIALLHHDLQHLPAFRGFDDVLHLHGFHHRDLLAFAHDIARVDVDTDDRSLHRCLEHCAVGSSTYRYVGPVARTTRLLAVMQDRERIARIDARTSQRSLRRLRVQARMPAITRSKLARMPLDERSIDFVRLHRRMAQQVLQEPDVRRDTFDAELAQCAIRTLHDVGEIVR